MGLFKKIMLGPILSEVFTSREEKEKERVESRKRQEKIEDIAGDIHPLLGDVVCIGRTLQNKKEDFIQKQKDNISNHLKSGLLSLSEFFIDGELPSKGDHIFVSRFQYIHHGIYIGGNKVVHYLREKVKEDTIENFADGKKIRIMKPSDSPSHYNADDIVKRAYSRINENSYNLIHNNCEHFARWCRCNAFNS